ncbi:hypothetical protein HN992_00210 [Candidatus Woesearchaeota archaeon]|jgi:hypothetical protein|nr:hypothetical protein [Candidatus Woesearchaeota archaeon]MBT3438577.1 hypothetical protein [Candidatus Woesearchaeota archaeon]MBT4058301.1 hypothetical protein [Candidatus Woesearchaeota archaeon]MBT4208024.1 hypothetical protein [Candidatus Woesearchaeota archaeon]MBT4732004.1 hypothetical protein [Candidatus Woesearchaeota archaeon]
MVAEVTEIPFFILLDRFKEIFLAPANYPEMLWIAAPLIITLFLTELYFSRYQFEELGWNSAYGNALVVVFVALDIFRYLFNHQMLETMSLKLALAISVAMLAVLLTVINFLHILPENMAYGLSSKLPLNFIAYIGLILIYSEIPIDFLTLAASIVLLVIVSTVIILLRSLIPTSTEVAEY